MGTGRSSYGWFRGLVHAALLLAAAALATPALAEKLVLAFGDSLTAGYGLRPNESFPAQLQAELRRRGIAARVHNGGVSGDTTAQGRARLDWVLRGLGVKPDLAIVELGANDMLRGLPVANARDNLDWIVRELRRRHIPVIVAGMLASANMGPDYRRQFDPIFPTLARKHGAGLYPFFLKGVAGKRGLTLPDGLHPNARGVAVIVRGMAPQVAAALRAPAGIAR